MASGEPQSHEHLLVFARLIDNLIARPGQCLWARCLGSVTTPGTYVRQLLRQLKLDMQPDLAGWMPEKSAVLDGKQTGDEQIVLLNVTPFLASRPMFGVMA